MARSLAMDTSVVMERILGQLDEEALRGDVETFWSDDGCW